MFGGWLDSVSLYFCFLSFQKAPRRGVGWGWRGEARDRGREAGRQEGWKAGRQEGRKEGGKEERILLIDSGTYLAPLLNDLTSMSRCLVPPPTQPAGLLKKLFNPTLLNFISHCLSNS